MKNLKYVKTFENFKISESYDDSQDLLQRKFRDLVRNDDSDLSEIGDLIDQGLENKDDILFRIAFDKNRYDIVEFLKSKGINIQNLEYVKSWVGNSRLGRLGKEEESKRREELYSDMPNDPNAKKEWMLKLRDKLKADHADKKAKEIEKFGEVPTDIKSAKEYYRNKGNKEREEKNNRLGEVTKDIN